MNQKKKTNWWGRNWKWFVPVGCFGSLILFVGFIFLVAFIVFGFIKSSDVYEDAVAYAISNQLVQEKLGTPIEEGLFVSGNINAGNTSGEASLAIPISGPNGKGTIYVEATKSEGLWIFSALFVEINESGQPIDLLE